MANTLKIMVVGALSGFAATLLVISPAAITAENPPILLRSAQEAGEVTIQGVKLSFAVPETEAGSVRLISATEGRCPTLKLRASNASQDAGKLTVPFSIWLTPPTSALSRVPVMPKQMWQESISIELGPGESRDYTIEPALAIADGAIASVQIGTENGPVVMLRIAGLQKPVHNGS